MLLGLDERNNVALGLGDGEDALLGLSAGDEYVVGLGAGEDTLLGVGDGDDLLVGLGDNNATEVGLGDGDVCNRRRPTTMLEELVFACNTAANQLGIPPQRQGFDLQRRTPSAASAVSQQTAGDMHSTCIGMDDTSISWRSIYAAPATMCMLESKYLLVGQ